MNHSDEAATWVHHWDHKRSQGFAALHTKPNPKKFGRKLLINIAQMGRLSQVASWDYISQAPYYDMAKDRTLFSVCQRGIQLKTNTKGSLAKTNSEKMHKLKAHNFTISLTRQKKGGLNQINIKALNVSLLCSPQQMDSIQLTERAWAKGHTEQHVVAETSAKTLVLHPQFWTQIMV